MKHLKLFERFLNEKGKNDWLGLIPLDKDGLADLILELDYSINGPYSVDEVNELREKYRKETEEDLYEQVSKLLSCETTEESIIKSLMEIYPDGYILSDNNEFHQDGGMLDDEN